MDQHISYSIIQYNYTMWCNISVTVLYNLYMLGSPTFLVPPCIYRNEGINKNRLFMDYKNWDRPFEGGIHKFQKTICSPRTLICPSILSSPTSLETLHVYFPSSSFFRGLNDTDPIFESTMIRDVVSRAASFFSLKKKTHNIQLTLLLPVYHCNQWKSWPIYHR